MIKVAICDDDNWIVHQMENILYDICSNECIKIDTEVYYSGNALERDIHTGQKFDLIYLDIQMEKGDGITTAKSIRKIDENVIFIFISSYDKYMMELFRLDVFAFIRKPIDMKEFEKIFLEANQKICSRNCFFTFRYKKQEFKIPCKDILYFESKGRQISVYAKNSDIYVFNGKLFDVEKRLNVGKIPFLRIHQSYLVNYLLIKARSKSNVALVNGVILPISEERQKQFSREYGRLLRSELNV